MPYLVCARCSARSYVTVGLTRTAQCPVCDGPLAAGSPPGAAEAGRADEEDQRLVRRHRAGDPGAFAALHARYAGELHAHARRLVGDAHRDDVVQDAFIRADRFLLDDARAIAPDLSLRAWLHTVVRNRCLDELRRGARATATLDESTQERAPGPLEAAVQAEELRSLTAAVAALPHRQRRALVAHVLDGEPHVVVADRLAVSVPATKSLVNRARLALRTAVAAPAA